MKYYFFFGEGSKINQVICAVLSKEGNRREQEHGKNVVLKLISGLENEGRILIADNFYSSVDLAEELLVKNTFYCGTVRSNRRRLPKALVAQKLRKGQVIGKMKANGVKVIKWFDKRQVLMITSCKDHNASLVDTSRRNRVTNEIIRKPLCVLTYNNNKKGVDYSDQMSSYYSTLRRGLKWYRKVMMELLLGTALINAWVIYNMENNAQKMTKKEFTESIIEALTEQKMCETINLPAFAYGASIGWMSPMTLLLQSENSPTSKPLTDFEISCIASIAYLVCVLMDFFMAFLGETIGRKKSLLFMSVATSVSWIILLSSLEFWAFIVARILIGVLMGGTYVICPLYTKEIAENSNRGLLGSFLIFGHVSGNLFLYIIGDILSYRTCLWVCLALPAIHLVIFMSMPESPSYLLKKGKDEEALRVMAWLRCRKETDSHLTKELVRLKQEQQKDQESSKFAAKAMVKDKVLFRAFRIAIYIAIAREVCGAIPVLNFAGEIFTNASEGTNLLLSPNQQAMMLGGVQVAGSVVASSLVEKLGRKPLLIITSAVSGLSMVALASWFVARSYNVWAPAWLPVVALCVCIFCDAAGLQPISVLIVGDIFSFKYQGTVAATTMALASVCGFLQMLFFKQVATSIGIHVAFYFFGVVCLAAAIYAVLYVPETKLKSRAEIYEDLKTKKEKEADRQNVGKIEMKIDP